MKKPQFAERQYEAAIHIELARGRASPFVPTQSIEAYIGIDAAADPVKSHAIWRILNVHIPRRVQLSPALWPALPQNFEDDIPGKFCSLFMQFKRPVYQDHTRAKHHARIGGPYFQVDITSHQQEALWQLQRRVQGQAVVRYASPAFWLRADFDRYDACHQILANSAFICPSQIKKHRKWMYASCSGKVVLNPDIEEAGGDDWQTVISEMARLATRQSLRAHIRSLAAAVSEGSDQPLGREENSWLTRISAYGSFSAEDNALLADLSVIALAADEADSVWIILLLPDSSWEEMLRDDRMWMWGWRRWWLI